jgi:hypothetical protein
MRIKLNPKRSPRLFRKSIERQVAQAVDRKIAEIQAESRAESLAIIALDRIALDRLILGLKSSVTD